MTLKLYQRDVAYLLGVSPETVLHWETGQTNPPTRLYPPIVTFLGYDPTPNPTTDAERLRGWRMANGLSVKSAARQEGVDAATWVGWERGQAPTRAHALLIERIIGA